LLIAYSTYLIYSNTWVCNTQELQIMKYIITQISPCSPRLFLLTNNNSFQLSAFINQLASLTAKDQFLM